MEKENNNFVRVELKLSSSTLKQGYDIIVQTDGSLKQEDLDRIAEMGLKTALKAQVILKGI